MEKAKGRRGEREALCFVLFVAACGTEVMSLHVASGASRLQRKFYPLHGANAASEAVQRKFYLLQEPKAASEAVQRKFYPLHGANAAI